jgi:MtaA/CmuA family methyltransferase
VIPPDAEPYIRTPPLKEPRELSRLRDADPWSNPRLRLVIDSTRLLAERVKGQVPIFCQLRSPFVLAANLFGIERTFVTTLDDPDFIQDLTRFSLDFCREFGRRLIAAGADVLELGNAVAGLMSGESFAQFAAEPLAEVILSFHDAGAVVAVHTCGDPAHILDQVVSSGADILEVDYPVDIAAMAQEFPGVTWMGNVHPVEVLLNGPAEKVQAETRGLLQRVGRAGRFILSAGCEPSIRTPREHLRAMVETAREFSLTVAASTAN